MIALTDWGADVLKTSSLKRFWALASASKLGFGYIKWDPTCLRLVVLSASRSPSNVQPEEVEALRNTSLKHVGSQAGTSYDQIPAWKRWLAPRSAEDY